MPPLRSAVIVEDTVQPFQRFENEKIRTASTWRLTNHHAGHAGSGGARCIDIASIADYEDFARREPPAITGDEESAGVRLEDAYFWIGRTEHERKTAVDAKRAQLCGRWIIGQHTDPQLPLVAEVEQGDQ